MTVEQVLQFLNSKDTMNKLADFIDNKLKSIDLPKDMSAYYNDDNDELADRVQDYGITFFCDFGDSDSRDDVYVMGTARRGGRALRDNRPFYLSSGRRPGGSGVPLRQRGGGRFPPSGG